MNEQLSIFDVFSASARRSNQRDLPAFDGATYDERQDRPRLTSLGHRVFDLMKDGQFRTLRQIVYRVGGSEAGVSARLRDLRKEKFGTHVVVRKRKTVGTWVYQLQPRGPNPFS